MACTISTRDAASCLLTLLLVQTKLVVDGSDFLTPLLSPISDEVCKAVQCGKGKCKPSTNNTFLYECQCDPGWKQSGLGFLPCVVPNCTMDYTCAAAPAPAKDKSETTSNLSILDPCFWSDCGGGTCNKTSHSSYECICNDGYENLFNASAFPCVRQCSIGMGCKDLGISVSNSSTPITPGLSDNGGSKGGNNIQWLIILATSLAMISFK